MKSEQQEQLAAREKEAAEREKQDGNQKKDEEYEKFLNNDDYIMGDTDVTEESMKVKCDYLYVPIGGYYTMDYKEAAILTNTIKPKGVYPIHFGSIVGDKEDFNRFKELINNDIEVINKLY